MGLLHLILALLIGLGLYYSYKHGYSKARSEIASLTANFDTSANHAVLFFNSVRQELRKEIAKL